jgi:hypothetical protein
MRAGLWSRSPSLCRAGGIDEKSLKPTLTSSVGGVELF